MLKIKKQWFTLVELIVVITILTIFWTILFISYQWFSKNARDSSRISDLSNIKLALENELSQKWYYPHPDNPIKVTYSWALVWTQWTIWDLIVFSIRTSFFNKPIDPLTLNEYTYSLINRWTEFQLWSMQEWNSNLSYQNEKYNLKIIKNVLASSLEKLWKALLVWNYNWKILRVSSWWIDYVLALPSIISTDLSNPELSYIYSNKLLAYNSYTSLPNSYKWKWFSMNNGFNYSLVDPLIYSWSIDILAWSWFLQEQMVNKLKLAYSESILNNDHNLQEFLKANKLVEKRKITSNYIINNVWWLKTYNMTILSSDTILKNNITSIVNYNTYNDLNISDLNSATDCNNWICTSCPEWQKVLDFDQISFVLLSPIQAPSIGIIFCTTQ